MIIILYYIIIFRHRFRTLASPMITFLFIIIIIILRKKQRAWLVLHQIERETGLLLPFFNPHNCTKLHSTMVPCSCYLNKKIQLASRFLKVIGTLYTYELNFKLSIIYPRLKTLVTMLKNAKNLSEVTAFWRPKFSRLKSESQCIELKFNPLYSLFHINQVHI